MNTVYLTKYVSLHTLDKDNTLLLNSLSGAMDIVDAAAKSKIMQIQNGTYTASAEDNELLEQLRARGYLYSSENDEQKVADRQRRLLEDYRSKKQVVDFVICPTTLCNLRCTYCFQSDELRTDNAIMSNEQVANIFSHMDKIVEDRNPAIVNVQLFGGEPLLPSTMKINREIFEAVRKRNRRFTIISNGTNIDIYKDLLSEYKDVIRSMQITVDGTEQIHDSRRKYLDGSGSFKKICDGIDTLLEIGIGVALRVNVDRYNIDSLPELIEFIKARKWTESQYFFCDIAPVTDHCSGDGIDGIMAEHEIVKRMAELFPEWKEGKSFFKLAMFKVLRHVNQAVFSPDRPMFNCSTSFCEANSLQFYVFAPDGYVYACPESMGDHQLAIGKFDDKLSLDEKKMKLWDNRNVFRIPKCRDCNIAMFCGGGCAYAALKMNNNIDEPVCNNAENILSEYIMNVKEHVLSTFA